MLYFIQKQIVEYGNSQLELEMNMTNLAKYYNNNIATGTSMNPKCVVGASCGMYIECAATMVRRSYCEYYHEGSCSINPFSNNVAQMIKKNTMITCNRCSQISCKLHHSSNDYYNFRCEWCIGIDEE